MDLSEQIEEQQIAIAIEMSMQYPEMEETDSSGPNTAATDDTHASPHPIDSEQVRIELLE